MSLNRRTRSLSSFPSRTWRLDSPHAEVNIEKYNAKNDAARTASLLPKQIREAKARRAKLVEAEKEFISAGTAKKLIHETIESLRAAQAMPEDALKRLEANLNGRKPGVCAAAPRVATGSCGCPSIASSALVCRTCRRHCTDGSRYHAPRGEARGR